MANIIDRLLDYAFVPKCGGCRARMDKAEGGLCKRCKTVYQDERAEYCDFCGMEVSICTCLPNNLLINACYDYRKLVFYKTGDEESIMRNIIYGVKRRYNLSLIKFFAKELFDIDKDLPIGETIVTYAPRTKKSLKEYGYDQAKLLAKYYAKYSSNEMATLLKRKRHFKQKEQKLLNFRQRAKNVKGAFCICNAEKIEGRTVILIDDVVTSGATLGECVDILYSAGAKKVICRSIAYTYRKNKQKND